MLFEARRVSGTLTPDPVEVVDLDWFGLDALPAPLLVGQHQRIDDALAGRRGVVRSSGIRSPFASRAEAYRRRDESDLTRQGFYEALVSTLDDQDVLQIGE